MTLHEWLAVVRREYLDTFIRAGGAAVKFVVPPNDAGRLEVREGLHAAAVEGGFLFALVDAVSTKVHMIDQLFHEIARQIDWDAISHAFLLRSLREMGLRLPLEAAQTSERHALSLTELATLNEYPEPLLRAEVHRWVTNRLYRDYELSREFRLAMIQLCLAQLDPSADPTLLDAINQWLRGELRLISGVKRALIFQKIARHNARHMLFSLTHFLTIAGKSGMILALDIARYADTSRPAERGSGLYYSTPATIDAYEVLRQLIDATDELESCFVGVLADPAFLFDDRRGLRAYQALYLRIADEVRDRYRPNPRSALVRLNMPAAAA